MSKGLLWVLGLGILALTANSTYQFLLTIFPAVLVTFVPCGWCAFEVGFLLWPHYAFSPDKRTPAQRYWGLAMTALSFAGISACFAGTVFVNGPDRTLFSLPATYKEYIVLAVSLAILAEAMAIIVCLVMLPNWHLAFSRNQLENRRAYQIAPPNQDENLIEGADNQDESVEDGGNQDEKGPQYTHNKPQAGPNWGGKRPRAGRKK